MNERSRTLPNLFLIGAPKSGTTTLFELLGKWPGIFAPYQKEPSFFSNDEYYHRGIDWYQRQFFAASNGSHTWRLDATPRYLFWGKKVLPRIMSDLRQNRLKFIAVFRNPIEMAYSYYWQNVRDGREQLTFHEALAMEESRYNANYEQFSREGSTYGWYTRVAKYADQLTIYLSTIDKDNMLFLLTEDLADKTALGQKLEQFLGIATNAAVEIPHSNPTRLPRSAALHRFLSRRSQVKDLLKPLMSAPARYKLKQKLMGLNLAKFDPPEMDLDTREDLAKVFSESIDRLEMILDRDLSHWGSVV